MFDSLLTNGELSIRFWDDPILSTFCPPVEENEFGPQLENFGTKMLTLMIERRGVGLAAPQCGLSRRLFVMKLTDEQTLMVCNPMLQVSGPVVFGEEGCLSLPGVWEQVGRPDNVIVKFRHVDGREDEMVLAGRQGRIVQHETDHVDGLMFFDRSRVSKQVHKRILQQWEKIKKNHVR